MKTVINIKTLITILLVTFSTCEEKCTKVEKNVNSMASKYKDNKEQCSDINNKNDEIICEKKMITGKNDYALVDSDWAQENEDCIKELDLDRDTIRKQNSQLILPEHNSDFNEYFACIFNKKCIQNDAGEINFDSLKVTYGKIYGGIPTFNSIIDACKDRNIRGNSLGQKAVKINNCIMLGFVKSRLIR